MRAQLSDRALQGLSGASFAFYAGSFLASGVLQVLDPTLATDWGSGSPAANLAFVGMTALFPIVGVLIVRRQPRNVVGWLLHATGVAWGLTAWTEAYTRLSLHVLPSLPGGRAVEVVGATTWWPAIALMGVYTLLFFPDGRLPSRRWRFLPWVVGVDCAAGVLLFTVAPGPVNDVVEPLAHNPLAVSSPHGLLVALTAVAYPILPLSLLAAAASLVIRFRGSTGVERVQLKWLMSASVFIACFSAVTVTASFRPGAEADWVLVLQSLEIASFGLIPVAIGIAITRHGLYGIDQLISHTLVVGALGVFITGVYVGVVVGIGSLIGQRHPSVLLSVVATALVAVAFQSVREQVTRGVNRLVYGSRATPYEVLSEFAASMTGTYTTAELLPRIAQTVSQCLAGADVQVWLRTGQVLEQATVWPAGDGPAEPVAMTEHDDVTGLVAERVVPVRHRGELLGAVTVTKTTSESVTPSEQQLLEHVASQTGLVLRNLRLVDDLHTSRQRLVTSQDDQRRRLERNLHDGAQQSLVAVALMLRMATAHDDRDTLSTSAAEAADRLQGAIAELRELARGLHPAILTDRGLVAAVTGLTERCTVPVLFESTLTRRLPGPVEGALYFVVAEALTNVVRYAGASRVDVRLTDLGDSVALEVTDDGAGGADAARGSGLTGLADRAAVVDGSFTVHSPPGRGTTLRCVVPLPAAVPEQREAPSTFPALTGGPR